MSDGMDVLRWMEAEIEQLQAENKRLRDALEDVSQDVFLHENNRRHLLIEQTLKGESDGN